MVVKAYKAGATTITSDYGWNVPTNPRLTTESTFSNTRLYTIIYPDDTTDEDITEFGGVANNPYNNLENTEGFRIKCYDSASEEGVLFNPADWDTKDYFVLLHADDHNKHHFAKITEILDMDSTGDGFEFSPKLGNEVAANTKFMIFSIDKTTPAIAISAGIKSELQNTLYVSRPLFYFYNDKLDKNNELDHNTKYFVRLKNENASTTINFTGTIHETTILTVQDYANTIVDYSKYTMKLELFDNLRDLDDPSNSPYLTNEGVTITKNYSDYNNVFPNARTDLDDSTITYTRNGQKRYAFYSYSPTKNNTLYNVIDANIQQSIGQRGGFAQIKLGDSFRIMPKKVSEFDSLRVRHSVHSGTIQEWFPLPATIEADLGSNDYRVKSDFDLKDFLSAEDEIKIGNTHLFIDGIGTFSGTKTQQINCNSRIRTTNESVFSTGTFTATEGEIIYRRAFKATATHNGTTNTLLTNFVMMEDRFTNLFVEFMGLGFTKLIASVSNTYPEKKLLALSYDGINYYDTLNDVLEYLVGPYSIQIERIDGEIEAIKSYKQDGQTFMELEGRDKFNKLLSPIVNKNFLFSEDIIYSSRSPYNKLEVLSETLTCNFDTAINALTFSGSLTLNEGDHIYAQYDSGTIGFVGEISATNTGTTHSIYDTPKVEGSTLTAYKSTNKNLIFNKALASNPLLSSTTSLSGASDKGIIFTSGRNISRATFAETLAGTSESGNGSDLGYNISNCMNIENDNAFQGILDNKSFDVVNTLIDFTIYNVRESGVNKIVKVAPYIPLTLGRVEVNYANTQDTTFSDLGTASSTQTDIRYVETTSQSYLSTIAIQRKYHNKPLYIEEQFVGFIIGAQFQTDYSTVRVYLDRKVSYSSGDKLQVLSYSATYEESSKLTHEMHLLNAAHLHTGKYICLVSPLLNLERKPILFDYPLYYNTMGSNPKTHTERFGPSIYRIFNIEKGNINSIKSLYSDTAHNQSKRTHYYTDKLSKIKYYASGYKMNYGNYITGGSLVNNIVGTDIKEIANHKMPETRGVTSVRGSNFFDLDILSSGESYNKMSYEGFIDSDSGYYVKDFLYQRDPKIARMFIFSTCDLLPYSSERYDSLLAAAPYSKTIENYSLFALKSPQNAGRADAKDLILGQSETINSTDESYISASIISANKTISSLKRFGIFRLTEVVYDWHFNQFDPENIVSKDRNLKKFSKSDYRVSTLASGSANVIASSATTIQYDTAISASHLDIIFDDYGRKIGEVSALGVTTTTITNDTLNLDGVIHTDGNQLAQTPHLKMTPATQRDSDQIKGHGEEDTVILNGEIHMLKSFAVNTVGSGEYGGAASSAWDSYYSATLSNGAATARKPNLFLPVDLGVNSRGNSNTRYSSEVVNMFVESINDHNLASAFANEDLALTGFKAVFFDRYTIEEGTDLVDKGMVSSKITGMSFSEDTGGGQNDIGLIFIKTDGNFGENESRNKSGGSSATTADGTFMGFKPQITLPSPTSNKASGNRSVYHYSIQANGENTFLNFVDLTGTYLVSAEGKYYDGDGTIQNSAIGESMNELTVTDMAYVISHELDHTNSAHYHILTLDTNMNGKTCRIMQPNHTCFYSYSPKEIQLNTLSSRYTKMGNEDKMYESINAYQYRNTKGNHSDDGNNEGVLSMYVLLDTDNQPDLENTIYVKDYTSLDSLIGNTKLEMGISDGENSYITSVEYLTNSDAIGHYLSFGEIKESLGIVSVSETIDLVVNGDITSEHKRTMIGTGVQIGYEAQDIVNNLLESENLQYETDGSTSYYLAPNFKSIDLFSAINTVLKKINKTIFISGESYALKDNQSDDLYSSNITIGDKSNVKVFGFEKSSSIFNFYNDIAVYGNIHKSIRKGLKSIRKVGRKSLEFSDKALTTESEVIAKARELFALYNKNNFKIELLVNHENISTLQVGDIVNVEIAQENIQLSTFLVLQMEHQLTGLIKLQLGKYSKLLEDTLAELVSSTRKNEKDNRSENLDTNEDQYYFLEDIKINIRKLLVRKRTATGGYTLGFSTPLNTGTFTLGFGTGAAITLTDLLEEEY